ncbi:PhoD-like phosphatase-domain-containing protein [Schizophyllum fasciatum]
MVASPAIDPASDVAFARTGAVYEDGANIAVRYPQENASEGAMRVLWRKADDELSPAWIKGPLVHVSAESDWVGHASIFGLQESTQYEYILSSTDSDVLPYPEHPVTFRTFPNPRTKGSNFRFISTSCHLPNFPYVPGERNTLRGWDYLADYLEAQVKDATAPLVQFALFLGDFIYADVPYCWGDDKEAYRRLYRRNYKSKSFRRVYEQLPIFHTYDDHEIVNNFAGLDDPTTTPYPNASSAFDIYNAQANYPARSAGQYYYTFNYDDSTFFVLDTRRYRDGLDVPLEERTMLGAKQLAALRTWIESSKNTATFKFVVSSVPFTSLWGHDAQTDCWPGFPTERSALLELFHSVPNLIILSGDRHEFAHIEYTGTQGQHTFHEVSASPMNMFYIPLYHTLKSQSEETVSVTVLREGVNGTEIVDEEVPRERVLKYIPQGNQKWATFEVDTRDPHYPTVQIDAVISGVPSYHYQLNGTAVSLRRGFSAIGEQFDISKFFSNLFKSR